MSWTDDMVQELLTGYPSVRAELDGLLESEGIRRDENLDYTCGIYAGDALAATGSLFRDTVRCLAVSLEHRGEGLLNSIMSHLLSVEAERGISHVFVYTKPETAALISSLGFYRIEDVSGRVVFMENRRDGFDSYLRTLSGYRRPGKSCAVVMNAAPFTKGHRYLVERASAENDNVHVFVLSEENGPVPFAVRKKLVEKGTEDLHNVMVHASGPYMISSATFPGYFFRDAEGSIRAHAKLDIKLFGRIAEVMGISSRYAGDEPTSTVTAIYNEVMREELPSYGLGFCEIPRLCIEGRTVSASAVRQMIHDGDLDAAAEMLPESTCRFLFSPEGESVIHAMEKMKETGHY